jgi:hypothetical protein
MQRVFRLTPVGATRASSISSANDDEGRALAWARRRGGVFSEDSLAKFYSNDMLRARLMCNALARGNSPSIVEVTK